MKSFPVMYAGERRSLIFRFGPDMNPGETITAVDTVTASVLYGADPTPAELFNGAASAIGTEVTVPVDPVVSNVDYKVTVKVSTSTGRTLMFSARLAVRNA